MTHQIKCANCIYAKPDPSTREGNWIGITCTNRESDFYIGLLNVTPGGSKLDAVTWAGCAYGVQEQTEINPQRISA